MCGLGIAERNWRCYEWVRVAGNEVFRGMEEEMKHWIERPLASYQTVVVRYCFQDCGLRGVKVVADRSAHC